MIAPPLAARRPAPAALRALRAGFVVGAALLGAPATAHAESVPAAHPPAETTVDPAERRAAVRAELEGVLREVEAAKSRQTALGAEIEGLARDRSRLAEDLVAVGRRLQEAERRLAVTEKRIGDLDRDLAGARRALEGRRDVLAEILAALQRMGRKPPPAVAVKPADALGAVRSAILLGAVLPELRDQADALVADLQAIEAIEKSVAGERDRFRAEAEDLVGERRRLEALVEERRKTAAEREVGLAFERRRAAELAEKAGSLRDLVAALEAAPVKPTPPTPTPTRETPFADTRGRLPLPVSGETLLRFGETDAAGLPSRGLSIATRAGAAVAAPCGGTVLFAGPFRSYGKLLIINGGGGYHVVLAGMERIDVEIGQTVLAGEPVGLMGARPGPATGAGTADRPILYVEFRRDGTPIDSSPWWATARDEKVRG